MKILITVILFIIPITTSADKGNHAPHDHSTHQHSALPLPDDIRLLLRKEMNELRKGMESLVFHIAAAQWGEIEKIGTGIENTFIMKQALTERQMHQLHEALPTSFKQLDKKFHGYAGRMADAAKARNMELVQFYRYQMNQACSNCHSRFAYQHFDGFTGPAGTETEHH